MYKVFRFHLLLPACRRKISLFAGIEFNGVNWMFLYLAFKLGQASFLPLFGYRILGNLIPGL